MSKMVRMLIMTMRVMMRTMVIIMIIRIMVIIMVVLIMMNSLRRDNDSSRLAGEKQTRGCALNLLPLPSSVKPIDETRASRGGKTTGRGQGSGEAVGFSALALFPSLFGLQTTRMRGGAVERRSSSVFRPRETPSLSPVVGRKERWRRRRRRSAAVSRGVGVCMAMRETRLRDSGGDLRA